MKALIFYSYFSLVLRKTWLLVTHYVFITCSSFRKISKNFCEDLWFFCINWNIFFANKRAELLHKYIKYVLDSDTTSSNQIIEEDLSAQEMIDFSPVYRCLHISTVLGSRATFESYYRSQRTKQARLVLQPPTNMVSYTFHLKHN